MGSNFVFQMLPVSRTMESILEEATGQPNPWYLSDVFRFIFIVAAVCFGTLVTNFGQALAVCGLLGWGALGMVFPVLCSLKIRGGQALLSFTQILQHVLVLVIGLATITAGLKAVFNGGANEVH